MRRRLNSLASVDMWAKPAGYTPQRRRTSVAVYPDGSEWPIRQAGGVDPSKVLSLWTFRDGGVAGPGKARAIEAAIKLGARIEARFDAV